MFIGGICKIFVAKILNKLRSKVLLKNNINETKTPNLVWKAFLTNKFKENNHYDILETLHVNVMNNNIKIKNIYYIVKYSKSIQHN
jgi:hypothetical protein